MSTNEGEITATYDGRVYIHVSFNGQPPQEVINVFDYLTDAPEIAPKTEAVEEKLRWWLGVRFPELVIYDTTRTWKNENE